ncbi:PaaI family thioesterase [Longispora albida]|uniref:PaaI family thioesterase n=1 Tax=Longispora albida TaxID=203523 RepID=UPI00058E1D34|nr:PaaI family thioesterase [Longispora albida]
MTAVETPWAASLSDYRCFGCSPHNPHGLQLVFHEAGDALECTFQLGRTFESYPGMVHGGVIGTICDEVMGNLIVLREGRSAFTVGIRLRYLAPLSVGEEYRCVARVRPAGQLYQGSAEVLDRDGTLLVTATGTFQPVDMDRAREHMHLTDTETEQLSMRMERP